MASGLRKSFGKVRALDGVHLQVAHGTVMALLGPNGAGKTTMVRVLTTLLHPDAGMAMVNGYDVVRDAGKIRALCGLAGQYPAVDEILTGHENLEMVGRLYHMGGRQARRRADELLERFGLSEAGHRKVTTYSGGMRRRLDLAASIVNNPSILFLDEPTTGLDPRSRFALWATIKGLVEEGTTILLSTQYLEEADHLADEIAVLDSGKIIREGTAEDLKTCCGGDAQLQVKLADRMQTQRAREVLKRFADGAVLTDGSNGNVSLPVIGGTSVLPEVVRQLDSNGIGIADLSVRQPNLDDVFLSLTGRTTEPEIEELHILDGI